MPSDFNILSQRSTSARNNRIACYTIPLSPDSMCVLESMFHVPCGHWGGKLNSLPCARAKGSIGLTQGCWDANAEGVVRLDTMCASCRRAQYKKAENPRWSPLGDISVGAWRHINQRSSQGSIGSQENRSWAPQPEIGPLERRRSRSKSTFTFRATTNVGRPCHYFLEEPFCFLR